MAGRKKQQKKVAPAPKAAQKKAKSRPAAKKPAAPKKKPAAKKAPTKPQAKKAPSKPAPSKPAPSKASSKASSKPSKASSKLKAVKPVPKAAAPVSTAARDARKALEAKRAINSVLLPAPDGKAVVDSYMRDVDHPFKAEMEAVRAIIVGASDKVAERIKWNAPSFFYKEDLGAFHPRATEYAHLILLFPGGAGMDDASGLLEGNHKDRREAKFHSMDDVKAKKPALEKLVKRWVALRDR